MHALQCLAITGYHTPQCEPQRRSGNAQTQTTTHYQHRARKAWQALLQSKVQFDSQRFGFAFQNDAELAYGLGVYDVYHKKSMGTGKNARAFVLKREAKNLAVSQTRTEFMFSSEVPS